MKCVAKDSAAGAKGGFSGEEEGGFQNGDEVLMSAQSSLPLI